MNGTDKRYEGEKETKKERKHVGNHSDAEEVDTRIMRTMTNGEAASAIVCCIKYYTVLAVIIIIIIIIVVLVWVLVR